jgi:hypothetical protein
LIGIYPAELLGVNPSSWYCHVDLDDFNILWEKDERYATLIRKDDPKIYNQELLLK